MNCSFSTVQYFVLDINNIMFYSTCFYACNHHRIYSKYRRFAAFLVLTCQACLRNSKLVYACRVPMSSVLCSMFWSINCEIVELNESWWAVITSLWVAHSLVESETGALKLLCFLCNSNLPRAPCSCRNYDVTMQATCLNHLLALSPHSRFCHLYLNFQGVILGFWGDYVCLILLCNAREYYCYPISGFDLQIACFVVSFPKTFS